MYEIKKCLFLHCQTPLHAGSGAELGVVDLPIQREKHTGFPKVEASGIKGALREELEHLANNNQEEIIKLQLAFGYDDDGMDAFPKVKAFFDTKKKTDYAGALGFSDARLLLFPLKSVKGLYVWASCPAILERFRSEMQDVCGINPEIEIPYPVKEAGVADLESVSLGNGKLGLEGYLIDISTGLQKQVSALANSLSRLFPLLPLDLANRFVVLPNDLFSLFTQLSTEVVTRTKIDNATGTVSDTALFTEEYLPAESLLYALVFASPVFQEEKIKNDNNYPLKDGRNVWDYFQRQLTKKKVIQIGGNYTLGKGLVRTSILNSQP